MRHVPWFILLLICSEHLLEVAGQGLSLLTTPSMHGAVSSVVSRPSVVSTLTMMLGLADALTTSKTVYFVRHGQVHPASPVHPAVNPLFTLCVEKCSWQAEHNVLIEGGRRDEARRLMDPPLSEVHLRHVRGGQRSRARGTLQRCRRPHCSLAAQPNTERTAAGGGAAQEPAPFRGAR